MVDLYQLFFQTSKADFETARENLNKSRDHISLYHYQQSFEKGLKALHIFKYKHSAENYSDSDAYKKTMAFNHNIEKSHLNFFSEMANFEKSFYNKSLNEVDDQTKNILQKAITSIDGFINSLEAHLKRLNLATNFIKNINNYNDFVDEQYQDYLKTINIIPKVSTNFNFLSIVSTSSILYPCLFNMDTITRYPVDTFNYNNLEILKNQSEACKKIEEMLSSFRILVSNTFKNLI